MEENNNTNTPSVSENKMNPMLIGGVVVAILVIGAVAFLGMNSRKDSAMVTTPSNRPTENITAEVGVLDNDSDDMAKSTPLETSGDVNIIQVEGGSFYYKPNEIKVKKGEKVRIVLNSVDMMHDFVVDELNIRTKVTKGGETSTVEFTPEEAGEFEFYCSVGQHRANGMVGTLVVEE